MMFLQKNIMSNLCCQNALRIIIIIIITYKYKICNKIFENGFAPLPLLNNVKKTSGSERNGFPKKTEYNTVEFLKSW